MRMKSFPILLFALSLSSMLASAARAQSYSIDWFTIAGGGGSSTGSVYSVRGTIGQPAASGAPMTGGNYSLTGGFWALYAVQTEGAPLLTISRTNSVVMVSWSSPATNWTLQQNTDLSGTNWIVAPEAITNNGTLNFIIVNPPADNRYYRLFRSQGQ
jgi:hypothetical protein